MSNPISWLIEVEILPGKLDDFRTLVRELVARAEKESGTIDYEWHLSPDGKTCHIFERYADSAALVKHGEGFGQVAARFFASCKPVRLSVYGEASAEAKAAIADLHPVYYSTIGGFSR
ncbi:MAG TPA: antibiotic biosynthesis monooxygenase [Candidatus Methylacidiphilales bacterium]|jgi:quinol monooxygenase YgiN|nr:antibiotic biosynthesis monooxygenase [Candidatus Methylacidiphilales bacterium]